MLDTLMTNLYRAAAGVAFATGLILLIPLIGMQVTGGVDWTLMDFVGAAILLFGTGFVFVLAARIGRSIAYRTAIGIVLAAALSLVWLELAVGVFTSLGS